MARLFVLLLMTNLALLVVALFDCLSCDERKVRALPQRTWVFVILLTSPIGALAWFIKGQPAPAIRLANGTVLRHPGTPAAAPRPAVMGPDDDPEFLQSLAAQLRRQTEEK
ncbi:MAG: PLD nuclease N-terminal domain-containing protein [Actinoplanes sp.]